MMRFSTSTLLVLVQLVTITTSQAQIPEPDQYFEPSFPTMSIRRSAPLVFPAAGRHTATVIFAHGLGDTGHGWASAVENWRRRQRLDEVKFILPHAPVIPITANMGMSMPGWFDIKELGGPADALQKSEDEEGVKVSAEYFQAMVQAEIDAGIPANRIVLGGFSQGGAMAIFSGLTARVKLAGIVGLSSWLLLNKKFAGLVPADNANLETPIFMGHGDRDRLVHTELGQMTEEMLKRLGYKVTFKVYRGMEHSACLEELDEVEGFLRDRLPPLDKE